MDRVEQLVKQPYSRVLTPDENGGYVADVLELPGCFSEGETADEAIENLEDAMRGWFEVALEQGRQIPEPMESSDYNGRVLLRLPRWLHKECVRRSLADGTSLNQWLLEAVSERVGVEGFLEKYLGRLNQPVTVVREEVTTRRIMRAAAWDRASEPALEAGKATDYVSSTIFEMEKQHG